MHRGRRITIGVLAGWAALLAGCDSDPTGGAANPAGEVARIAGPSYAQSPGASTVSPAVATIAPGATAQLTALDAYGNPVNANWQTSNSAVATVSGSGLVTGVGAGSAVITAKTRRQSATASVTVTTPAAAPPPEGGTDATLFGRQQRPYTASSPWNTPIAADAPLDPRSASMVATIRASSNGLLRSDPRQYSYPLYFADASTPRRTLTCTNIVSIVQTDGTRTSVSSRQISVPIPSNAVASPGSDAQIVVVDMETGDEYDVWQFVSPGGCTNLTKYVGGVYRSAVETSYTSRGAGVPYLAGLIRPWEIAKGEIAHALAFGYPMVRSGRCVWPASKTDGQSAGLDAIPEGARLRLDPTLDVNQIAGLDATGRAIARALQRYGAFVIDVSGSNKIYAEDDVTAAWGAQLVATTVSAIPVDRLQVMRLPDGYWADSYQPNHGRCVR